MMKKKKFKTDNYPEGICLRSYGGIIRSMCHEANDTRGQVNPPGLVYQKGDEDSTKLKY